MKARASSPSIAATAGQAGSLRSRGRTYVLLVGLSLGMLIPGLALPFILGESVNDRGAATGSITPTEATSFEGADQPLEGSPRDERPRAEMNDAGGGPATTVGAGAASGPAGSTADPSTTARRPVAPPAPSETTTGQGSTAAPVKVGFLLIDIGQASRAGFNIPGVDPEQQQFSFQVYLDDLNARGGIHGRRVEGVFRTFDVFSEDDQRAACLELTQDHKVFAVVAVGGYAGPPILCITEENATPLINMGSQGTPSLYFERSGGRLFSVFQAGTRHMFNWVAELDRLRALKDRKIGVLASEDETSRLAVDDGLLPALKDFGYTVVHRSRLSADVSTAAGQIPVEVQQMRGKGVDAVLLSTASLGATQFVQTADAQQWYPSWHTSDLFTMYSDTTSQNMPSSYDGALNITTTRQSEWRVGIPESKRDVACRRLYEAASGERLPRHDDDSANNEYLVALNSCGLVGLFATGAQAAGPHLTRDRFSTGMQSAGEVTFPGRFGGSLGPGKFDVADHVRTNRWYADCECWKPIDDFRRSRF